MGGSYLSEMKDLRDKETEMEMIRNFFLEKDKDLLEKNNKMRGILYDDAKVMRPTLHSSHPSLLDMGRGLRAESHHVPNLGSGPQLQLQPGVRARVHFVQVAMDWQTKMTNIFLVLSRKVLLGRAASGPATPSSRSTSGGSPPCRGRRSPSASSRPGPTA